MEVLPYRKKVISSIPSGNGFSPGTVWIQCISFTNQIIIFIKFCHLWRLINHQPQPEMELGMFHSLPNEIPADIRLIKYHIVVIII